MNNEWSYTRLTGPKGDAGSGFKVEFSALPMPENGDLEVDDGTSTSFLELSDGTNLFIEAGNDSSDGKGWHYPFTDGDLYMRTWSGLDKRWSMGTRIVGEDGEPAVTYEIDEPIVFRQGETATFRFYRVIEGKRYETNAYYAVATSDDGITYGSETFGTGASYTTATLNTAVSVRCRIYASLASYTAGESYLDEEFIELVNDGFSVHLGNENITLACDSSGKLKTAFSTNITVSTLMGTSRVASVITAGSQSTGITIGTITNGTVSADGIIPLSMSANGTPVAGKLTFTIAAGGAIFTKEVNVAVTKDGQQGEQGKEGEQGKGVSYETAYYALSTTATRPAQSSFSTTIPTLTSTNKYMWKYVITTYTDNSTSGGYDYAYIASVYGEKGDDAITLWTDTSIVKFSKRLDGTSNYETKYIKVRLYKGPTQIDTLTANNVSLDWMGDKSASGGTVTVSMNHSDGGSVTDKTYTITVRYGGNSYKTNITVTNVYGGIYLGKATAVNGDSVTIDNNGTLSTVTAKLGDYFTWSNTSTGSYTQGLCYEYRVKYNNGYIYWWGDVNGNAEAYSTAFGDIMSLVNAPESNNPAMIMAKNLAANQAFIGSLFSEYIKVLASIRVGDRYNESGTIIDNTKTGAWFGNSGILKAHKAELTELNAVDGTFSGTITSPSYNPNKRPGDNGGYLVKPNGEAYFQFGAFTGKISRNDYYESGKEFDSFYNGGNILIVTGIKNGDPIENRPLGMFFVNLTYNPFSYKAFIETIFNNGCTIRYEQKDIGTGAIPQTVTYPVIKFPSGYDYIETSLIQV